MSSKFLFIVFLLLAGCASKHQFQYDQSVDDTYLAIFVEARHLDYSDGAKLLKSFARAGDFGHAWITLHGKDLSISGGHSGELGVLQSRYFDGIMDNIEEECSDPIKYLWEVQKDGFFQSGSGGHCPTYAVKVPLTEEKFFALLSFINPKHYDYSNYCLTEGQCASFVAKAAEIAGLDLQCEVSVPIPRTISLWGQVYTLWEDPIYSRITFTTPDHLEMSLMRAVKEEKAELLRFSKRRAVGGKSHGVHAVVDVE